MFGKKSQEFTYQERPLQICCAVSLHTFTEMDFERTGIEDRYKIIYYKNYALLYIWIHIHESFIFPIIMIGSIYIL